MNEPARVPEPGELPELSVLAEVDALLGDEPQRAKAISAHTARRDSREVVMLRCFKNSSDYVVECDVYPVNAMMIEPLRPGPYHFQSLEQAKEFIAEALQVLTYLDCEVAGD